MIRTKFDVTTLLTKQSRAHYKSKEILIASLAKSVKGKYEWSNMWGQSDHRHTHMYMCVNAIYIYTFMYTRVWIVYYFWQCNRSPHVPSDNFEHNATIQGQNKKKQGLRL